ncbi:DUF1002 domain-containing protein [Turicibacter sp. TJ11]|uniref:DUF1002 domain-containing protein n=1 Tax=Turicibacter sp. TJ11 TaxID=2806443 RepID=UPI001F227A13|nr:DUF1002 domain-containing protein [Turicibacter sp. TJ11]
MLQRNWIKKVVLALAIVVGLTMPTTAFAKRSFSGEYRQGEILSFGSSLTKNEEANLREYFGVSDDMKAIYVDNETAIKQLGLAPNALDNYTGGWYSSAYVKLTSEGGVQVNSKNVSLVTNEMFTNALITSGILNCEVIVSAPFMVTGESALAGILAGAEEIMGESLSEENKVVAQEEIDTTLEIADEILNDEENEITDKGDSSTIASGIINDIKEQVIKDSPNSTQIGQIIINVTNNYGVELSEETQARVQSLMEDVNDLDIEYNDIKDTMQNIGNSISESLKEAGIKLQESGLLEKIGDWMSDFFSHLFDWIKGLFTSANEVNSSEAVLPENELSQTENVINPSEEATSLEDETMSNEPSLDEEASTEEQTNEELVEQDIENEELVDDQTQETVTDNDSEVSNDEEVAE